MTNSRAGHFAWTFRAVWLAGACALALVVAGCGASAQWDSQQKTSGYALPRSVTVLVSISEQVAESDDSGATAALVETLDAELRERGYSATVITSEEPPLPMPRVEVRVLTWDSGDRTSRWLVGLGAGAASIVVDCHVVLGPPTAPTFVGRVRGSLSGGHGGGEARGAAEAVARAIADAITRPG